MNRKCGTEWGQHWQYQKYKGRTCPQTRTPLTTGTPKNNCPTHFVNVFAWSVFFRKNIYYLGYWLFQHVCIKPQYFPKVLCHSTILLYGRKGQVNHFKYSELWIHTGWKIRFALTFAPLPKSKWRCYSACEFMWKCFKQFLVIDSCLVLEFWSAVY